MNITTLIIVLLLFFVSNSYALNCNDIRPGSIDQEKNMEKLWIQAQMIGIGSEDREYQNLVYEICNGDERMLNLLASEGIYAEKDVDAYRNLLNRQKTTDDYPESKNHYTDTIRNIDGIPEGGYPVTINYIFECFAKSESKYNCPNIFGVLRGDKEFKNIYNEYWAKNGIKSLKSFDIGSDFTVINYMNKKYLHFSLSCKYEECTNNNNILFSESLYNVYDKKIIGYFTDMNMKKHISNKATKDELKLLQLIMKNNGISGLSKGDVDKIIDMK